MKPEDQAQLIRRLLKKQDVVIERLDRLNAEIEAVLKTALPPVEDQPKQSTDQAA